MTRLGGKRFAPPLVWAEIADAYKAVIPPYPGASNVEVPVLPAPPTIRDGLQEPIAAFKAAMWYRAAILEEFHSCRTIEATTARDFLSSPHYPTLLNALPLLIEHKLAPATWTAFSIHVWREYVIGGKGGAWNSVPSQRHAPRRGSPPSVKWVFSQKRLATRTDWFAWQEAKHRGGKMLLTAPHKTLIKRWYDMRDAIMRIERDRLRQDAVEAVVEAVLPARTYAALVAKAKEDAEWQRDEWADKLRRFVWLW